MKIWIEKAWTDYDCTSLHWHEPEWDSKYETWESATHTSELFDDEAQKLFNLKRLPDTKKHELFEVDLSGKPKLVCVWVPA